MNDHDMPAAVLLALTEATVHGCADCDSDTALYQDSHGIWHLAIMHDDTCPWFKQHQQRKATR